MHGVRERHSAYRPISARRRGYLPKHFSYRALPYLLPEIYSRTTAGTQLHRHDQPQVVAAGFVLLLSSYHFLTAAALGIALKAAQEGGELRGRRKKLVLGAYLGQTVFFTE